MIIPGQHGEGERWTTSQCVLDSNHYSPLFPIDEHWKAIKIDDTATFHSKLYLSLSVDALLATFTMSHEQRRYVFFRKIFFVRSHLLLQHFFFHDTVCSISYKHRGHDVMHESQRLLKKATKKLLNAHRREERRPTTSEHTDVPDRAAWRCFAGRKKTRESQSIVPLFLMQADGWQLP